MSSESTEARSSAGRAEKIFSGPAGKRPGVLKTPERVKTKAECIASIS